ncbi:solute carrier family 52, riboflavin transporter, member 3-A isoform X2 [Macrosteles quadrilineatus]|uniref:solute carrier family 52, riboflavin transporter, member 3-A isoform X2 n=1 Tax=Macrosteles quadrilineatus TaxID=74068 RepID=UPI0023E32358|nr:solute carrier family 52, riboflavin transporter, member 3-A isoform X2 [Macrosteles quadrilineatus]
MTWKKNLKYMCFESGSESSSLIEESIKSPQSTDMKLSNNCWKSNRKLQVDIFACMFGISAWVSINGMFTQLPILVQTAPEGWSLPSYLSLIIQFGNIGPVLYSLSLKLCPQRISDSKLIYFTLFMGCASLMSLGLFYDQIWVVFDERHSMVLFINTFFLAIVGCISSTLYMPFMNNYPEVYLVSYVVGEGLSGFVPSIIGLVQGVGGNPTCVNSTSPSGEVNLVPYTPPPNFSPGVFIFILFSMMVAAMVSFFMLNNLSSCKAEKVQDPVKRDSIVSPVTPVEMFMEPNTFTSPKPPDQVITPPMFKMYLVLTTIVSMVANGALPSAQSYSCLPYGSLAYHLAVNLGNMANPIAAFLADRAPHTDLSWVISLFSLSGISIVFSLMTAAMSPNPPLQHSGWGTFIIVVCWVMNSSLISYVKMSIATVCRRSGGRSLYFYGMSTQAGAFIGSSIMFYLITSKQIFTSYNPCS